MRSLRVATFGSSSRPRQVGKTTLVEQVTVAQRLPVRFVSADETGLRGSEWLAAQWEAVRIEASGNGGILVVDDVQKVGCWSETVKRLWDEDSRKRRPLKVVLLGSAPLLIEHGLSESLAGRFETMHLPHWSLTEMQEAFGFTLDDYLYFGGYPGAAPLAGDPARWRLPGCSRAFRSMPARQCSKGDRAPSSR